MSIGLKVTDLVAKTVLWLFASLVVLLAVMTSLLRYYLPQANDYQKALFELLSDKITWQIQAESVEAKWHSFRPDFRFTDITIQHPETGHHIQLNALRIELNIAKSLFHRRVYVENLEFDNLSVLLLQNQEGRWAVTTSETKQSKPIELDKLIDKFWSVDTLFLSNIKLAMQPYQGTLIAFPETHIQLQSWLNEKILEIEFVEDKTQRSKLTIQTLNYFKDADFLAQIYWQTNEFPLHLLLSLVNNLEVSEESRVSQQIWLKWQNQQLSGSGTVTLDSLQAQYKDKQWLAKQANASFYIDAEDQHTVIAIPSLQVNLNQQHIQLDRIKLLLGKQSRLQIEQIDLAEIDRYLQLLTLPPALQELRETLEPKGFIQSLQMNFANNDFLLKANLHNVSVGAWKGAPALHNVTGYVEAQKLSGFVQLDTQSFSMAFPKLYDTQMNFTHAQGTVFWRIDNGVKVGSIGNVMLNGQYGQAIGEFQLELPHNYQAHEDSGRLSLVVDIKNSDARFRNDFIPNMVDESLSDWLDKHILSAQVEHGSFIYHGPIDDITDEEKVVELWLSLEDGAIKYDDQFPAITKIAGEFILDQTEAEAQIASAESFGLRLYNGQLRLTLTDKQKWLDVSMATRTEPVTKVLSLLKQPAFQQYTSGLLDEWQINGGQVDANIHVTVPIHQPQELEVAVNANLQQTSLALPNMPFAFDKINGDLSFSLQNGFASKQLSAQVFGKTVRGKIIAEQGVNRLLFSTDSDVKTLHEWLQLPALYFITGTAKLDGQLSWSKEFAKLEISSDLQGIQIELPEPFAKTKEQQRLMRLELPLLGEQQELSISLDDGVQMQFLLSEGRFQAGRMNLGIGRADYIPGFFRVQGQVLAADAEQWIEVVERFKTFPTSDSQQQTLALQIDQISIRHLKLFDYPLESARFSAIEEEQGWSLALWQRDIIGELLIPHEEPLLYVSLEYLNLAFLQNSTVKQDSGVWQTNQLPLLKVNIDRLALEDEQYGRWNFMVLGTDQGVEFQHIEAKVKHVNLSQLSEQKDCRLSWTLQPEQQTAFSCKLSSDNIKQALKAWDFQQSLVSQYAHIDILESSWQGSPVDFSLFNSKMLFALRLEEGHFADMDSSTTDALKAFSFFNINNFVRRIKLDFSDLSKEGLTFEKVTGTMSLDRGVLRSKTPLAIKGSSSEIKMAGMGDLNTEQLDFNMLVSLPLASNLPWIIALAAGLPAALGVFIVSKLLGKQVDKRTTASYHVTGDVQNPKVKFKRLFKSSDDIKGE